MIVDERYYCFGCHESGDVIDFTAKLFALSPYDAAQKLAADFGIDPRTPSAVALTIPQIQRKTSQREREGRCASVMIAYECLLKEWKIRYAPNNDTNEWDGHFAASCHALPQVSYLIDCLYSPDAKLREGIADELLADGTLDCIEQWLKRTTKKEVSTYANETLAA